MQPIQIIAFPRNGSAYTDALYAALERRGVNAIEGKWKLSWLKTHLAKGGIVHLHWPSFLYASDKGRLSVALRLIKFVRIAWWISRHGKLWWTAHNLYPHESAAGRGPHHAVRMLLGRLCDKVFAHGQSATDAVRHRFAITPDRMVSIPHGNWCDYFPPPVRKSIARTRLNIPQHARMVLFAGQCRRYKNIELLINSFRRLDISNSMLVIAGQFKPSSYYHEILRLTGDDHRIRVIPGFVSEADMALYYSACDASCAPYSEILTSGSAMMSLTYGRPFVSINEGFLSETVGRTCGVLVSDLNESTLAEGLTMALTATWDEAAILKRARSMSFDDAAATMLAHAQAPSAPRPPLC